MTPIDRLQSALRLEAGSIWNKQEDARAQKLWLHEETITEIALLNLSKKSRKNGLLIRAYNKKEEKRIGADWLWWFVTGHSSIRMRVQAKRLYPSGAYNQLDPHAGQIDTLIVKAKATRSIPAYAFYNNPRDVPSRGRHLPSCNCGPFRGPSYWGCSIALAQAVKRIGSNKLSDLVGDMVPWHCLASTIGEAGAGAYSLPEVVIEALKRMTTEEEELKTELLYPMDELPQWILRPQEGDWLEDNIDRYLEENELQGVLLFDATQERYD